MDLILHRNSEPSDGGSLDATDSVAQAISKFECGTDIKKLSPFLRTDASGSVRTCERFKMNLLESEIPWNAVCWLPGMKISGCVSFSVYGRSF
jgi:hypothetical protein